MASRVPRSPKEVRGGFIQTPRHLALQTALHLRARQNFRDFRGVTRRSGEEWLVTTQDTDAHVPDVYEEVMGVVSITTLGPHNYCVILDPVGPDGKNQLGQKRVVKVSVSTSPRGECLWSGLRPLDPSPCPPPTLGTCSRNTKLVSAASVHTCLYPLRHCPIDLSGFPDVRSHMASLVSASLALHCVCKPGNSL